MRRRADHATLTARIAELEAANRAQSDEIERLTAHLELAQAIAADMLTRRLAEGFAKDAEAVRRQLALQLQARSLHVYGASTRGPTFGVVTGL